MQNERPTAGETANPTNPYEEEILALNTERDRKVREINEKIAAVQDKNAELKRIIRDNHQFLKELHEQKDRIRLHYKRLVAAAYDRSQGWYFDPMHNSICRRLGVFFEMHPDMREQWMQDQETIRERIRQKAEAEAWEGGAQ